MKPIPLDNALIQLDKTPPGSGPVVIADYADNPGSGAYGDCTNILAALLVRGVENAAFGTILDPEAAAELVRIGVGATATLQLGGKTDARVGGGPISVTGTVKSITDGRFIFEGPMFAGLPGNLGPSACLIVGGMDILVVSERVQPHDKNIFRVLGIEPAETSILVVKSMQHFRSAFADIAREIIVTDAGGLSTMDHKNRTYRNLRRPVWPLDEDADFITELPV